MSPHNAIRMLKSIPIIQGRVLPIITCPRLEDAYAIRDAMQSTEIPLIILHSTFGPRYFCQSIAFVYCVLNDIEGRYFAVTDDDIEFIKGDIFPRLDNCPPFSVFGFSSNQVLYGFALWHGRNKYGEYIENPLWLDAHNMWSKWENNLVAGLPDSSASSPNAAFVEVEYQHRLRLLTGQPTIGCTYAPIHHYTRIDDLEKRRGTYNIVIEGYKFWEEKFGLVLSGQWFVDAKMNWDDVDKCLSAPHFLPAYKKHLVFGGLWTDWQAVWDRSGHAITKIYEKY
jgi:hypothetical protein